MAFTTQRWLVPALALWLFITSPGAAQDRISDLPRYERYKQVSDNLGRLVTGGSIGNVQWDACGRWMRFERGSSTWQFDLERQLLTEIQEADEDAPADRDERPARPRRPDRGRQRDRETSPDGRWIAACESWNVVLRSASDEHAAPVHVTTAGYRKHRYGTASWVYGEELDQTSAMWWSPDSRYLAYYEFDERQVRDYYLLGGLTEIHTELLAEGYPKAGEPNPVASIHVHDVEGGSTTRIDVGADPEQYVYSVRWSPAEGGPGAASGSVLLFNRTNRHQNTLEVLAADPATGGARVVVTESQPTWQENSPELRFLKDHRRFIWGTERSGWKHLELRDLDGRLLRSLTQGEFPCHSIVRIDEDDMGGGVLYFAAYNGDHPLNLQLNSVRLDGSHQQRLTPVAFHHGDFNISPDGRWFTARRQTVTSPPATVLYDDLGREMAVLAASDTSRMCELGAQPAEMFTFKAADGKTDLFGILQKPSGPPGSERLPLIVDVYGGPQSRRVHNTFGQFNPLCELGYIIAVMDNRGTTGRGKAFESANYLKLGDVDLADQAAGVRFLAQRPDIDAGRVGITGHSYGGYMAALGVMKHPDVFHAAVAGSAVTDWRHYDTIYTERYMRTPAENAAGYEAGSCLTYVDRFRGRLLLLHGMLDDNVHPANAFQLIDALQRAGKPVEMVFYANRGHGGAAGVRDATWAFFHRHLVSPAASVPLAAGAPGAVGP
jgi:dipeptidyl-peptidase-4